MSKILPNQIYAGIYEILKDNRLFYHSKIGADYCHLTEEGEAAALKWIKMMAPHIIKHEEDLLDKRAKELVIAELKK